MVQVRRHVLIAAGLLAVAAPAAAQRFLPDDPLWKEPPPRRADKVTKREVDDVYDLFQAELATPGEKVRLRPGVTGGAVNTLGEVPDSAWYTNRHYWKRMSIEELKRGPGNAMPPSMEGKWTITSAKTMGITPGFGIVDSKGRSYLIKLDPKENPEMASAADIIGSKLFHALGYFTPENYIVRFRREDLKIGENTQVRVFSGRKRQMIEHDIDEMLLKSPREKDGRYRALASLILPGSYAGPFRYYGTRKDDPNDIVPHERRRDLRGLYVFAAWTNHDDTRARNTLDLVVQEGNLLFVRHHLIDFGAILGSASSVPNPPRGGYEYFYSRSQTAIQILTLGLAVPYWARARYPDIPSAGKLEYELFDPERFKANYPIPAFDARLPDDEFWGAKQVMNFTSEEIRALVSVGEYSDPRASEWVTKCLVERRDKIGRAFFKKFLPLDRFEVKEGRLVFEDLEVKHRFREARSLSVQWYDFDNRTGFSTLMPGATSFAIPDEWGGYAMAEIRGEDPKKRTQVYLRRQGPTAEVVGLERIW